METLSRHMGPAGTKAVASFASCVDNSGNVEDCYASLQTNSLSQLYGKQATATSSVAGAMKKAMKCSQNGGDQAECLDKYMSQLMAKYGASSGGSNIVTATEQQQTYGSGEYGSQDNRQGVNLMASSGVTEGVDLRPTVVAPVSMPKGSSSLIPASGEQPTYGGGVQIGRASCRERV